MENKQNNGFEQVGENYFLEDGSMRGAKVYVRNGYAYAYDPKVYNKEDNPIGGDLDGFVRVNYDNTDNVFYHTTDIDHANRHHEFKCVVKNGATGMNHFGISCRVICAHGVLLKYEVVSTFDFFNYPDFLEHLSEKYDGFKSTYIFCMQEIDDGFIVEEGLNMEA